MTRTGEDRGLSAVARVRGVRERDSRLGVVRAVSRVCDCERLLEDLRDRLAVASSTEATSLDELVTRRHLLAGMAVAVREAEQAVVAARTVAMEARIRWQSDKNRVAAVERLLERRALRREEEARRADVRLMDDLVGSRHGHAGAKGGPAVVRTRRAPRAAHTQDTAQGGGGR